MEYPREEVAIAVEKISDGIIEKMEEAEARREREFTYKLKELEYYKSNYDKELKDIFNFWFDVVRITHIKDNKNLTSQEKDKYQKKYNEMMKVEKIAKYKMNTLKYGGKETGRVFALESKLHQEKYSDKPFATALFMWCAILAVLKKEILGQDIDPLDIIQVLVNDFDDHETEIREAKEYVKKVYISIHKDIPYWIESDEV